MRKTAIVPVEPDSDMILRTDSLSMTQMTKAELVYCEMLNARPPVPDELIEEAAKALFKELIPNAEWDAAPSIQKQLSMALARAAARVFNGGT